MKVVLYCCLAVVLVSGVLSTAVRVAVANRDEGTVSVINSTTGKVIQTINAGTTPAYVANIGREVFVSDSAQEKLLKYKLVGGRLRPNGTIDIPGCIGAFHLMSTQDFVQPRILILTCPGSRNTYVIDPKSESVIKILPVPKFSPAIDTTNAEPHDFCITGRYLYITYLKAVDTRPGFADPGFVVQYRVDTFQRVGTIRTVSDPHNSIGGSTDMFIAAQGGSSGGGAVYQVDPVNMARVKRFQNENTVSAHGIHISADIKRLYTTNILDNEVAVVTYDIIDFPFKPLCDPVSTNASVPHNVATASGRLFVAHSGPNNVVSMFDLDDSGCPIQSTLVEITVGQNAFGILDLDIRF